jgi:hypothetical protein
MCVCHPPTCLVNYSSTDHILIGLPDLLVQNITVITLRIDNNTCTCNRSGTIKSGDSLSFLLQRHGTPIIYSMIRSMCVPNRPLLVCPHLGLVHGPMRHVRWMFIPHAGCVPAVSQPSVLAAAPLAPPPPTCCPSHPLPSHIVRYHITTAWTYSYFH